MNQVKKCELSSHESKFNRNLLASAIFLGLSTSGFVIRPASAATINVQDGVCSLVDAIRSANTDSVVSGCIAGDGADEIILPDDSVQNLGSVEGYLSANYFGLPVITTDITIEGNNSTLQRDESVPGLEIGIFGIDNGGRLVLRDSTVTKANNPAGSIIALDDPYTPVGTSIVIERCVITQNTNTGFLSTFVNDVVINESEFSHNTLPDDVYQSAGAFIFFGSAVISNSTFSNNVSGTGGGLETRITQNLEISNVTVSGNTATNFGAGGLRINTINASITGLTVTNNNSMPYGGYNSIGSSIFSSSSQAGAVTISHSIFSGHRSLFVSGGVDEIFLNADSGVAEFSYNVIGENSDASIVNDSGNPVTLDSTNIVPTGVVDDFLGPLVEVDVLTPVHMPISDGILIDAGAMDCGLVRDQLNTIRPLDGDFDGGFNCDIGSIELVPSDIIFKDDFEG